MTEDPVEAEVLSEDGEADLVNTIGMKFRLIPPGSFIMGQEGSVEPVHRVRISRPFYLGMHTVTQKQWMEVMKNNPCEVQREDLPVVNVSWHDCLEFMEKLAKREEGWSKHSAYRLPTEAEWEYACRGGTTTRFSFDDSRESKDEYMWHHDNSVTTMEVVLTKLLSRKKVTKARKTGRMAHPVGQLKPNPFGLYDMHGNVYEWCEDWYGDYGEEPEVDPAGSPKGTKVRSRMFRGGSYMNFAGYGSSAHRDCRYPKYRGPVVGFRVVKEKV